MYKFRNLNSNNETVKLKELFDKVFIDENVGDLALLATDSLPGVKNSNWYVAEDDSGNFLSALVRVPWNIEIEGIEVKTWEQAIVGTLPEMRGKGFIRKLNSMLDSDAEKNDVDMIFIQGIPGFYNKFGYRFAIEMENFINLDIDSIQDENETSEFIPMDNKEWEFFVKADSRRKKYYSIYSKRDRENYDYYLGNGKKGEYASDFIKFRDNYIRIQHHGFGDGLIISEISEEISLNELKQVLIYLKKRALEEEKDHLRFNLGERSPVSRKLYSLGGKLEAFYGWQVKIINPLNFLKKIKPLLNRRVSNSQFRDYSGVVELNIGTESIYIRVDSGEIEEISSAKSEAKDSFFIPRELFEPLVLGYRSYRELAYIRPELGVFSRCDLYIVEVLFPKLDNWIYSIW